MLLKPFTIHTPDTLAEASQLYSELKDIKILAGGTFLLNSLKLLKRKGTKTPQNILSLKRINELKGASLKEDSLIIRSMTIINDLFESPLLTDNFKVLKTVCRNISTNPIRNMATVGGNLTCRYTWTEMGAVMIALEAMMHFTDSAGTEEILSAEDFFKNSAKTNKIFTHVSIKRDPAAAIAYRRIRKSLHVDIPLLAVCVKTNIKGNKFTNSRVAVNSGVTFAQRDYLLEKFLDNSVLNSKIPEEALDHLDSKIYDTRSDDYKKHMFRASLKSALSEIIEKQTK